MGDRIDSKIEDHRRDPDPHPRITKRIDADIAALRAAVTGGGAGGAGAVVPLPGNTEPSPILPISGTKGSSLEYARKDHVHGFDPANAGMATADALNAEAAARAAADEQLNQQKVNRTGDDRVTGELRVGSSKADDQALADGKRRMVVAQDTGVQEAVTKAKWRVAGDDVAPVTSSDTEVVLTYGDADYFTNPVGRPPVAIAYGGAWVGHDDRGGDSAYIRYVGYHRALRRWIALGTYPRQGIYMSANAVFPGCNPLVGWTLIHVFNGAGHPLRPSYIYGGGSGYGVGSITMCGMPDGGVVVGVRSPNDFGSYLSSWFYAVGPTGIVTKLDIEFNAGEGGFPGFPGAGADLFCPRGGTRLFCVASHNNGAGGTYYSDPPYVTWTQAVLTGGVGDRCGFIHRADATTLYMVRNRDGVYLDFYKSVNNGATWGAPYIQGGSRYTRNIMVAQLGGRFYIPQDNNYLIGYAVTTDWETVNQGLTGVEINYNKQPYPNVLVSAGGQLWVSGLAVAGSAQNEVNPYMTNTLVPFTVDGAGIPVGLSTPQFPATRVAPGYAYLSVAYRDDGEWGLPTSPVPDRLAIGPNAGLQLIDQAGATKRLMTANTTGLIEALANPGSAGSFGAASKTLVQTIDLYGRVSVSAETPIQISESQVTNLPTDLVLLRRYAWAIP